MTQEKSLTLIGLYVHIPKLGEREGVQGQIIRQIGDTHQRIQLFSWLTGLPTVQAIARNESIDESWDFYEDINEWQVAGERLMGLATDKAASNG